MMTHGEYKAICIWNMIHDTQIMHGEHGNICIWLGTRRIGFHRNRLSTGNQTNHSVSGLLEPDFHKFRSDSGRTGFQHLTGPAGFQNSARFLPDFQIQPDSYRNPKFCWKIIVIYPFAGCWLTFSKVFLGLRADSKTFMGSTCIDEELSFSMLPSILT